jgi:hypothetical protein
LEPSSEIEVNQPVHGLDPAPYLAASTGRDFPPATAAIIDDAWQIAQHHYVWLMETTGLEGKALVREAQARSTVNRSRRLVNRLPRDWPVATRKAVALIYTGSPALGDGLVIWWATTRPDDVPLNVRRRWAGLVAVVDPQVATLPETARRRHRDHARQWTAETQATPAAIAV